MDENVATVDECAFYILVNRTCWREKNIFLPVRYVFQPNFLFYHDFYACVYVAIGRNRNHNGKAFKPFGLNVYSFHLHTYFIVLNLRSLNCGFSDRRLRPAANRGLHPRAADSHRRVRRQSPNLRTMSKFDLEARFSTPHIVVDSAYHTRTSS